MLFSLVFATAGTGRMMWFEFANPDVRMIRLLVTFSGTNYEDDLAHYLACCVCLDMGRHRNPYGIHYFNGRSRIDGGIWISGDACFSSSLDSISWTGRSSAWLARGADLLERQRCEPDPVSVVLPVSWIYSIACFHKVRSQGNAPDLSPAVTQRPCSWNADAAFDATGADSYGLPEPDIAFARWSPARYSALASTVRCRSASHR